MIRNRVLSAIVVLGLLLPVLAACGGAAATNTAAPAPTDTAMMAAPTDTAMMAAPTETAMMAAPSATTAQSSTPIVVASKDFAEEFILGNMYALMLEDAGFQVTRKLNLGGTPVAQAALEKGDIDLYPEYTGTGLLNVLNMDAMPDPKAVYDAVAKGYKDKFNLVWLDPAPMNDTQALAMTADKANSMGIKTISDMAARAGQLTMIGPAEFKDRVDGLPGIQKAYGNFQLKNYLAVDPGLRYQGLVKGDADVVVAFSTDGEISANKLVVLQDDKKLFPPYQVAPVVRQAVLDANPGIKDALNKLAPKITDDVMSRLNYEVTGNKREPADVAKEFLQQEGLIKK